MPVRQDAGGKDAGHDSRGTAAQSPALGNPVDHMDADADMAAVRHFIPHAEKGRERQVPARRLEPLLPLAFHFQVETGPAVGNGVLEVVAQIDGQAKAVEAGTTVGAGRRYLYVDGLLHGILLSPVLPAAAAGLRRAGRCTPYPRRARRAGSAGTVPD